jgi:hypothetical protein
MSRPRGSESKPRRQPGARWDKTRRGLDSTGRELVRQARRAKRESAARMQQSSKADGVLMLSDYDQHGHKKGLVIGVSGPYGGISTDPATIVSHIIRRAFRPREIAPCVIKGPDGTLLRTITYGPNGEQIVTVPGQAPTTLVPTPPRGRRAFNVRRRSGTYQPLPDRQGA